MYQVKINNINDQFPDNTSIKNKFAKKDLKLFFLSYKAI